MYQAEDFEAGTFGLRAEECTFKKYFHRHAGSIGDMGA